MATKKKPTSKLNEAVRKIGNLTPLEAMLPPVEEPKPMPAPLLPPRWWEEPRNAAASPMERADPTLTVSPQVAQVLNMGIDRLVDVTTRLRGDHEFTLVELSRYRWNDVRVRDFLRNVRARLGPPGDELVDAAIAVRAAIDQYLREGMP